MGLRVRIDPALFLLGALALLVLPLGWLYAAMIAAAFHELCHYAAIRLCGLRVNSLMLGTGGAVMETEPMERGMEAVCAAAGPIGSLILLLFVHIMPQVALCGAVQGIYNLLPIYPLDGGRVMRCLISVRSFRVVQWLAVVLLLLAGAACSVCFDLGILPLLFAILTAIKALDRKFPCKEA